MTRTELQAALKEFRTQTYFLRCKLNAKTIELQAEYDRIQELEAKSIYHDELAREFEETETEETETEETYKGYTIHNQPDKTVYITAESKPGQYVQTTNRKTAIDYIDSLLPTENDIEDDEEEYDNNFEMKIETYEGIEIEIYETCVYVPTEKGFDRYENLEDAKKGIDKEHGQLFESVKLDFNSELNNPNILRGQYCDILDSESYSGRSCLIDRAVRSHYVCSEFNFPIAGMPEDSIPLYWLTWNHAYEHSLACARYRLENKSLPV